MGIFQAVILGIGISIVLIMFALQINPISEIRGRIRQIKWKRQQEINGQNELKVRSLSQYLENEGEIDLYIEYTRHNLPREQEWDELLVGMIKELLSVGWDKSMPIYTKYKYGSYDFSLGGNTDAIHSKIYKILWKYNEIYETGDYLDLDDTSD